MNTPKRFPKGTWMRLQSRDRLRAFVGPEPDKKMSQRTLARYAGVTPGFINHLTSGRRSSCSPIVARRIVEAIGVPLEILFVPETSSTENTVTKSSNMSAAPRTKQKVHA